MEGCEALLLVGLLLSVTPALRAEGAKTITGGLAEVSVQQQEVIAAAAFAVRAQEAVMGKEAKGARLSLVKVLSAQHQVVAGLNYFLRLEVKADKTRKIVEAVVWLRLSGDYELTSWRGLNE